MPASKNVINHFEAISQIPRCSGNEEQIRNFLCDWAREHKFATQIDPTGNLLITVTASPGCENCRTIILQCHMDMVCEKNQESRHDFSRDPIRLRTEGEWLEAHETTLGADNGVGMAIAMALAEETDLRHPALELLFTVDEETGLTGANGLTAGFLTGSVLINLDSEEDGVFTIGCAGGRESKIILTVTYEPCPDDTTFLEIRVHGLMGGHSGVNIGEERGNANVILAQLLTSLAKENQFRLAAISGGSAHNAIPREAKALLALADPEQRFTKELEDLTAILRQTYRQETKLTISHARQTSKPARILTKEATQKLLDLMIVAPHGVISRSKEVPGLVETSVNFATIREGEGEVALLFSQRSDRQAGMNLLTGQLEGLARLAKARIKTGQGYPGWQPDMGSELLARSQKIYRQLFDREARIEVIHAGLECGIIGALAPKMEMISIGPTIQNPHSPEERLHLPSLEKISRFTRALIASYCSD